MSMLTTFKLIIVYSFPLIALIGLITNTISFVIFSRKRFRIRKKLFFQLIISCFIICFNFCLYTPYWFYYLKETIKNQTNKTSLFYSYECLSPFAWLKFISLLQQCLIPFSLMLLFTLLTIRIVFNSRKASSNNTSTSKSKDLKFAISSITFNILFLLLCSPYFILLLIKDYSDFFNNKADMFILLNSISYFLYYISSCLSIFTNYVSNSIYKKEFDYLFLCRKNNSLQNSKS